MHVSHRAQRRAHSGKARDQIFMYTKDTALEIQFSPQRLNDTAGDPYWIDLSPSEAWRLLQQLQSHFAPAAAERATTTGSTSAPVFALDAPADRPHEKPAPAAPRAATSDLKQWICVICGWIYDEAAGLPEDGIPAGTRWQEIPDDWRCPLCDVGKQDFALVEF